MLPDAILLTDVTCSRCTGGTREWFRLIARELLNANYALFKPTDEANPHIWVPNPLSHINPGHLTYFRFAGQRKRCTHASVVIA